MPPKPATKQPQTTKKSIVVIPSRAGSRPDDLEGVEQTEIAAHISIPAEGGWGWVVVFASFCCIFILDGVSFTFGAIYMDMSNDLDVDVTLISLINSVAIAFYFIAGPISSALINRFGFRACIMLGSVIDSFALLCTYFSTNYGSVFVFYGGCAGLGYCLINMSSSLIVGFYFQRLRSLALSMATTGSSLGVMIMFPINSYITNLAGWRVLTLLHSGLFGLIFFLGMTFKPLLSLTVVKTTEDPTKTVTYLPSLATSKSQQIMPNKSGADVLVPTATEKLFKAVSNVNFPTAAAMVDERLLTATGTSQEGAGPSTTMSKITLTANSPHGISPRQQKQVQAILSRTSVDKRRTMEVSANINTRKKQSCWARLCHWEKHVPQSRPLYRDDAFYDGKMERLPIYQKSVMDTSEEKTGLEYQLAVSRAVTTVELQEHRGVFTTAARRVLATMMDPTLLKRCSFLLLCVSGFLVYLGYLVPYVFLPDRNSEAGMSPNYCAWLISALALSNACGRLLLGAIACKVNPLKLFIVSTVIAGVSTMCSNLSFHVYFQYGYCCVFGFFIACIACLRSMVLVELYGLEKLTNATGITLLFQGVGSLICTPMASTVKATFGYAVAFYLSGTCITLSGLCLIPVKYLCNKESESEVAPVSNPGSTVPPGTNINSQAPRPRTVSPKIVSNN